MALPFSVLDLSPIPAGSTARDALRNTIDLAQHAERLGCRRYWLAEHHNTASLASSAPEVLIGHVAAATSTIRVGSGGIMLPNHSALHVAEAFKLLEALHPGRIDLGIGRAPGTDGLTAYALRRSREALTAEDFPDQMHELLGFLGDGFPDDHPFGRITASPAGVEPPDLWMLGSSDFGGRFAARLGIGFAFAHHINPGPAIATMRAYRAAFRPSRHRAQPATILAVSSVCAATDDDAEELAATVDLSMVRFAQGRVGGGPERPGRAGPQGPPSFDEARAYVYSPEEEAIRRRNRARYIVGGVDRVLARITELADAAGADEVMVTTMVHDHGARRRAYELLADAFAA
jgi:luciferase family oxidoreductase group 1